MALKAYEGDSRCSRKRPSYVPGQMHRRSSTRKDCVRGSAKLFANFECHARSYYDLKGTFIEEFDKTLNSRHIQRTEYSNKKDGRNVSGIYLPSGIGESRGN